MWRLLILSAVLSIGLSLADDKPTQLPAKSGGDDHDDHDDDHRGGLLGKVFGDVINPRLAANALRIVGLTKKLEQIKEKLHEAEKIDPEHFLNDLDARISHLEGTHCDDRDFQCGGNEQECVSDLLVCDGHDDCHNGHDEDKDVCDTSPVKAGNVFSGVSHWKGCLTRPDHITKIIITSTIRRKFFKSRIWIKAKISSVLPDPEHPGKTIASEFVAKGFYNFAHGRLVLLPKHEDDDHHKSVVCHFHTGDHESAECHRVTEGSLHECADLHVNLEHDDDDKHH